MNFTWLDLTGFRVVLIIKPLTSLVGFIHKKNFNQFFVFSWFSFRIMAGGSNPGCPLPLSYAPVIHTRRDKPLDVPESVAMDSDSRLPGARFESASSRAKGRLGEEACDRAMRARGYQPLFTNKRFFGVEIDRIYGAGCPVRQILFAEIKLIDGGGGHHAAAKLRDFLRARAAGPQTSRQRRALEGSMIRFLRSYPLASFSHVLICVDRRDVLTKRCPCPKISIYDLGTGADLTE